MPSMSNKRLFSWGNLTTSSEALKILVPTLADATINTERILTMADFPTTGSEILASVNGANALSTTDTILPLAAFTIPSVNGITLASNTVTATERGQYIFQLLTTLSGATTYRVKVQMSLDGGAFATWNENEYTVGAAVGANAIVVGFNFPQIQNGSVDHAYRFFVSASAGSILSSELRIAYQGVPV